MCVCVCVCVSDKKDSRRGSISDEIELKTGGKDDRTRIGQEMGFLLVFMDETVSEHASSRLADVNYDFD